jgi:selenide,water dikinase
VTGYGLAGHGWEIADRSGVVLRIDTSLLPLYDGARDIADAGHRTGGDPRNRTYVGERLIAEIDDASVALCMDPQTSGGLLAAVPSQVAQELVQLGGWTVVGEFVDGTPAVQLIA